MKNLGDFVRHLPEASRADYRDLAIVSLCGITPAVFLFRAGGCFLTDWGIRRWKGLP